jgi:hypothetical protein
MGACETEEAIKLCKIPLSPKERRIVAKIIFETLQERGEQGHPLKSLVDYSSILEEVSLRDLQDRLLKFVNTSGKLVGVLAFDVGQPWWSSEKCLEEVFVYCLDPDLHGFGRIALRHLEDLAETYGCSFIEAGGAACVDSKPLENLYMKKGGFSFSYPNFIKRLEKG